MKHCVIVGSADINNYEFIRKRLCSDDYVVFCDNGLKHLEQLRAKSGLIVGDFDFYNKPHLDVYTIVLPCEKEDTDTVFVVKEEIKRGFEDFLLIRVSAQAVCKWEHNTCYPDIFLPQLARIFGCTTGDFFEQYTVDNNKHLHH